MSSSVCEMQENNSERSLNLAHFDFDTGLTALMSPAVSVSVARSSYKKQTNKDKHKKHPNALFLTHTKNY